MSHTAFIRAHNRELPEPCAVANLQLMGPGDTDAFLGFVRGEHVPSDALLYSVVADIDELWAWVADSGYTTAPSSPP